MGWDQCPELRGRTCSERPLEAIGHPEQQRVRAPCPVTLSPCVSGRARLGSEGNWQETSLP